MTTRVLVVDSHDAAAYPAQRLVDFHRVHGVGDADCGGNRGGTVRRLHREDARRCLGQVVGAGVYPPEIFLPNQLSFQIVGVESL